MRRDNVILILLVTIISMLYLRQCEKVKNLSGADTVVTEIDTLYKEGRVDTVYFPEVKVVTKWLKPDTIHEISVITAPDGSIDTVKTFVTNYSDSALDASITCKVKGDLLYTKLNYVKKFPKFIHKVDTLVINKETTITKKSWGLYAGGIVGGNNEQFTFQPALLFQTKKSLQFSAGYEFVNKTYNFGVYTKIPNPF